MDEPEIERMNAAKPTLLKTVAHVLEFACSFHLSDIALNVLTLVRPLVRSGRLKICPKLIAEWQRVVDDTRPIRVRF